ncbi:MAG: hypothetical protein U1G07_24735 [Verrucomicrobiota bacterium]
MIPGTISVTFSKLTARAVYIDGIKDGAELPAKEEGAWRVNTTSIGGILRANPTPLADGPHG